MNDKIAENLDLLTEDSKFNYVAYLLVDGNGSPIKVVKYSRTDKVDLTKNEKYVYYSLIKATKSVLDKLEIEKNHKF